MQMAGASWWWLVFVVELELDGFRMLVAVKGNGLGGRCLISGWVMACSCVHNRDNWFARGSNQCSFGLWTFQHNYCLDETMGIWMVAIPVGLTVCWVDGAGCLVCALYRTWWFSCNGRTWSSYPFVPVHHHHHQVPWHLTSKLNITMKQVGGRHLSGWLLEQLCIIHIISLLAIETDAVVEYGHFITGSV